MARDSTRDPASGASFGANQAGVREHNERLVLSLIQRRGALASAEIARATGLSPQTTSVILRKLEADGLLERGSPMRGKVGKPLTPLRLRPEGIFSFGLKIGRRTAELVLVDVSGRVRGYRRVGYTFPAVGVILDFLREALEGLAADLPPGARARICGIGIGLPFEMWSWAEALPAKEHLREDWRVADLAAEIARFSDLPVHIANDATAACAAELAFGRGRGLSTFAYLFMGYFVGGGVVIDGAIFEGPTRNAAAFGTIPVGGEGTPGAQLLQTASLCLLESRLAREGRDAQRIWNEAGAWEEVEAEAGEWMACVAAPLARAVVAICSVIDFEAVLIDGAFPPHLRARLVAQVDARLDDLDLQGISRPRVMEAAVGAQARSIGAAFLPVSAQFMARRAGLAG